MEKLRMEFTNKSNTKMEIQQTIFTNSQSKINYKDDSRSKRNRLSLKLKFIGLILIITSAAGFSLYFYMQNQEQKSKEQFVEQQNINEETNIGDFINSNTNNSESLSTEQQEKGKTAKEEEVEQNLSNDNTQLVGQNDTYEDKTKNSKTLPTKLQNTTTNKIVIPKIGVEAELLFATSEDPESALEFGAWIVNDFSIPPFNYLVESAKPVIIASHLYGYDYWTEEFRNRVSFKGMEQLQNGDTVEVYWDNRIYKYEITDGETSETINNYSNDLILYTCNDLNGSDLRVIRYANLLEST